MVAALLSPYRTKQKRRRVRRRTSGRTVYAYVGGNPVSFIDPLGLVWVTVGYDYHGTSNFGTWWLNRLNGRVSHEMESNLPGAEAYEYLNTKRDVIQEWTNCPEDEPKGNERRREIKDGTQRRITQTFVHGEDGWAVGGYSYHWTPGVPNETHMTIVELMQNSGVGP